ncbi:MAG: VanZ family protein [Acidobacteria bacterium]|nr:MAG: VanZ family protein [Acidobacteriota bacterium]REK10120.1 MAG: VanZ family protein [Acidobacteriota bacterium]
MQSDEPVSDRASEPAPPPRSALLWPSLLGVGIVAMAPFWGSVALPSLEGALGREGLRSALTVLVLAAGVALLVLAVRRIRERRAMRFGLLAVALSLVVLQALTTGRDEAAVERVHFVLYGGVALLLVRALSRSFGLLSLPLAMVGAAAVGIADEWVQWLTPVRVGDVFDVGLNLYAAFCGALVGAAIHPPRRRLSQAAARRARRLLAVATALFVLTLAGFLHCAHLGHRIVDPAVGSFNSFFTADQLVRLNERRAEEWGGLVPGPLRALEVEDYFRTEAAWHVLERNRARNRSPVDHEVAWREDRILELYYPTFRELRRADGTPHYRIPDAEWQELAARFPDREPGYVSGADNGRIWIRPTPPQLWTVAVALALTLLLYARSQRTGAAE